LAHHEELKNLYKSSTITFGIQITFHWYNGAFQLWLCFSSICFYRNCITLSSNEM